MWRNADVLDFISWLRAYNDRSPTYTTKVGFYGLDLYGLYGSIEAVLTSTSQSTMRAAMVGWRRMNCSALSKTHVR
jgi:erythromycin esterase-like protein